MRCAALFSFALFVAGVAAAPVAVERNEIECRGGGISLLNGNDLLSGNASPDIKDSGNPVFTGNGSPSFSDIGNGNGNPSANGNGNGNGNANGNPSDFANGSGNAKGNGANNGNKNDAAAALGGLIGALKGKQ